MNHARRLMQYRATFEPLVRGSDGGGGTTTAWGPPSPPVACFAFTKSLSDGSVSERGDGPVGLTQDRVVVPTDTRVSVGDRVTVRTRDGTRVIYPAMIVDALSQHHDHLALICRRIA